MMKVWLSQSFLPHDHFNKDTSSDPSIPLREKLEEIEELPKGMMSIYLFVDNVACFVQPNTYYLRSIWSPGYIVSIFISYKFLISY